MSSLTDAVTLTVQFAVGVGVNVAATPATVLEIETSTAGGSSAIDEGRIETTYGGIGGFVIDDATLGLIETGGVIPDELVPEADWVSVECTELGAVTIESCRRTSRLASFDGGTARITLVDPARRWDPVRASAVEPGLRGEFAFAGRTQLREGVRVRVLATFQGQPATLFSGFVSSWPTRLDWTRDAERTVQCHDWFGVLAKVADRNAGSPVGASDDITARINRLLDIAGVPAGERDIGSSIAGLQSTTLSQNLLTELKLTAACDGGDLWVTPSGVITFRSRVEQMQEGRRWSPQMTATNDADRTSSGAYTSTLEVAPSQPPVLAPLQEAKTRIELARVGGTAQTVNDTVLADEIGLSVFSRSDLILQNDSQVLELAQALMDLQPKEPVGLAEVQIDLGVVAQARIHGLQRRLGDRIAVRHRDPDSATITREGVITSITHEISPQRRWSCVMRTDDAEGIVPFTIETSAIESNHFISF